MHHHPTFKNTNILSYLLQLFFFKKRTYVPISTSSLITPTPEIITVQNLINLVIFISMDGILFLLNI